MHSLKGSPSGSHGCSWREVSTGSSALSHILKYHDRCTAPLIKERDGIPLNPVLLDAVFCIEATFVVDGDKRKVERLGWMSAGSSLSGSG